MKIEELYSKDLIAVLSLMENEIIKEYPTYTFDIDYFTYSVLESRQCAAYKILDDCIISSHIEVLRNSYADILHKKGINKNIHILNPNKNKEYDNKLIEILSNANIQRGDLEDKQINTEHVFLSLLSDDNIVKKAFEKTGVDYKLFRSRVLQNRIENSTEEPSIDKKTTKQLPKENILLSPNNSFNNTKPNKKTKINNILQYSTNLNRLVEKGEVDTLVGREEELKQLIKVLSRRNKNNIILVGQSGCGKTALINGLAEKIISGNVPTNLYNKEILLIDLSTMISGAQYRGIFEERVRGLISEIKESDKYILFFDDVHLSLAEKQNNSDVINMFNSILSDNNIRVITSTTFKDYKSTIENISILSRKLQKIIIEPTNIEDTIKIIHNNKHYYEKYHNVEYTNESIETCVKLTERYVNDRCLPDSALDLIDETGAFIKLKNETNKETIELKQKINQITQKKNIALEEENFDKADLLQYEEKKLNTELKELQKHNKENISTYTITENDILEVLSKSIKIPVKSLDRNDLKSLANINNVLKKNIFGQDEAIDKVCQSIKRNRIGLKSNVKKPSTFLLIGSSGVGKTFLAKQLAKEVFGNENSLVRLDMSEYSEKHTVSKIIGSPAGYVGYGDGSFLLETVKHKKHCVLLLDEIEKACQEVFNIFLTLFEDGYLTDSTGNKIDFSNTIIIMTSNIGTRQASEYNGLGFNINNSNIEARKEQILKKELKKSFAPEFINRINNIIYFKPLSEDNLKKIVISNLNKLNDTLLNKKLSIKYDNNVVDWIYNQLKEEDKNYGGRPILRIIENNIEEKLTDLLIENEYKDNHIFKIKIDKNNELIIK